MENNETLDATVRTRTLSQVDHPSASSINTLGILGLVFTFILGLVGLILNIINLAKSGSAKRDIESNPGMYSEASIRKVNAGRTCSIVGLSIQGGIILIVLIAVLATA